MLPSFGLASFSLGLLKCGLQSQGPKSEGAHQAGETRTEAPSLTYWPVSLHTAQPS